MRPYSLTHTLSVRNTPQKDQQPAHGVGSIIIDARIHYPVHKHPTANPDTPRRHQHTPTPQPPTTSRGARGPGHRYGGWCPHRPKKQPHTTTPRHREGRGCGVPVPSGPNSAPTPPTPTHPAHPHERQAPPELRPAARTRPGNREGDCLRCSTNEHTRPHPARSAGGHTHPGNTPGRCTRGGRGGGVSCSLERR